MLHKSEGSFGVTLQLESVYFDNSGYIHLEAQACQRIRLITAKNTNNNNSNSNTNIKQHDLFHYEQVGFY